MATVRLAAIQQDKKAQFPVLFVGVALVYKLPAFSGSADAGTKVLKC